MTDDLGWEAMTMIERRICASVECRVSSIFHLQHDKPDNTIRHKTSAQKNSRKPLKEKKVRLVSTLTNLPYLP